jgi:AbrB family looped-hinge helix DNA binding protein
MSVAALSPKFQVVIPKEVRKQFGLKPGQRVQFSAEGDHISLKPILSAEEMTGILKPWAQVPFKRDDEDRSAP